MKPIERKVFRCAIYTRKSTEHNLDLEFNSLDAQREACEAYIKSQAHEGWRLVADRYDDGGVSGASLERPARAPVTSSSTVRLPLFKLCDGLCAVRLLHRELDFISGMQGIEQQTIRYFKIFAGIGAATADCAGVASKN